jgi:hypothetical protein
MATGINVSTTDSEIKALKKKLYSFPISYVDPPNSALTSLCKEDSRILEEYKSSHVAAFV